MNRLLRRAPLVALLLYALLTIFYTRPLLLHISTAIAGGGTDGWNNYWDFWWTPFAIFDLHQSPFHTDWIFYQTGTSLYFHTLQPLNGLISAPFQILGVAFAENIITLLSYLLTAFATYLLARLLLGDYLAIPEGGTNTPPTGAGSNLAPQTSALVEAAAFLAGFAFAFASPWRVQYLYGGQTNRLSIQWVPLFLYFAYRAWQRRSWRDAFFAMLCILAAALTELQYVVYIAIFAFILLLVELVAKGWRAWLPPALRVIGAGVAAIVVLSPLLIAMLRQVGNDPSLIPLPDATILHSTDLLELFAPNRTNPIWGGLADHLNLSIYSKYLVFGAFSPPYIILGLAIVALVLAWRWLQTRVLFISLLTFLLISFGPLLQINGKEVYTAFGGNILMPYAFLYYLPFMKVSRDPERFGEMAFLFWSLLAALGSFILARRFLARTSIAIRPRDGRADDEATIPRDEGDAVLTLSPVGSGERRGWLVAGGFALALLLAGIEFVKVTPPITSLEVPPFYQQLAKDNDHYAILELPFYKSGDEDQWFAYQAIHQKYLFGGNLARKQSHPFIEDTPVLDWFAAEQPPSPDIVPTPPVSTAFDVLRWANVRYVTLIKQPVAGQNLSGEQALIDTVWGANASPVYSDTIMAAYQVPPATVTATVAPAPLLALGEGWYTFEADSDGGHRWVSGDFANHDAGITILDLGASGNYTLSFRAFSYAHPYQVVVDYHGRAQTTLTITPAAQTVSLPLAVDAGRNPLTFHVLGEPASSAGKDRRLLSVGFGNFALDH